MRIAIEALKFLRNISPEYAFLNYRRVGTQATSWEQRPHP
jgi:hypothetical protein